MNINETVFFNEVRASVFKGSMKQSQVEGCQTLLNAWHDDYADLPLGFLAYCLATTYHETAHTMQPIREYGRGRGRSYGVKDLKTGHAYYGRGYVQLTWKRNYLKAEQQIGVKLVKDPDKVMQPDIAARILFEGCVEGWFTGKKLSDYISDNKCNYRQARRIVNGMDKATLISGYAKKFEFALKEAMSEEVTPRMLENAGSRTAKAVKSNDDAGGAIIGLGVAGGVAEALSKFKTVSESLMESIAWLVSFWWVAALVAGALIAWNNRHIIKARLQDEIKIGRLSNDSTD